MNKNRMSKNKTVNIIGIIVAVLLLFAGIFTSYESHYNQIISTERTAHRDAVFVELLANDKRMLDQQQVLLVARCR